MSADSTKMAKLPLDAAFPNIELPVTPFGSRVLVQIARIPKVSAGGIVLVEDTRDTMKWNTQSAKLVAVGPLAFKKRDTGEGWPEGVWAEVGDYVRVPRWDGDRIEIPVKGSTDPVVFVIFNDAQLIGKINGDPLDTPIYEL